MLFDIIHQALITHTGPLLFSFLASRLTRAVYTYVIVYFGDAAKLESVVWSVFRVHTRIPHNLNPLKP